MKTSQAVFVFAALFITICSAAPSNSAASHSSRLRANCAELTQAALPAPILHMRLSAASVNFEFVYLYASGRTAKAPQPVTLTVTVARTVSAELLLGYRHFRFAVPRRSA